MPGAGRPPLHAREPLAQADTAGPAFTEEAIIDAVNAAKTDSTVIAFEWTSATLKWDRFEFTRPRSLYFCASGGLGWGLPAAIGLQLGDPSRRVVALLGDGAVHYSISGLWTAAQHNIPVVFVVARNSEYRALKEFTQLMHAPDTPGLELPGMDIPGIATSYGVQSERVTTLSDLTRAVKDALSSDGPHLIEISSAASPTPEWSGQHPRPGGPAAGSCQAVYSYASGYARTPPRKLPSAAEAWPRAGHLKYRS
jgi:benzoylformate decarboxylase